MLENASPYPKWNKSYIFWSENISAYKTIKELVFQELFFFLEVSMHICFSGRGNSQYKHLMKTIFIYLTELTQTLEIGTYWLNMKSAIAEALEIFHKRNSPNQTKFGLVLLASLLKRQKSEKG